MEFNNAYWLFKNRAFSRRLSLGVDLYERLALIKLNPLKFVTPLRHHESYTIRNNVSIIRAPLTQRMQGSFTILRDCQEFRVRRGICFPIS